MHAQIMIDQGASCDEVEAICDVLTNAGIDGPCTRSISLNAEGMWLVLIVLPPRDFIESVKAEKSEHGWMKVKHFFEAVRAARNGDSQGMGEVVFRQRVLSETDADADPALLPGFRVPGDRSSELMLTNGMPDHAYQSLCDLDLREDRNVLVYWDPQRNAWRETLL